MSRRKLQWRDKIKKLSGLGSLHQILPGAQVHGTGTRAYEKSPKPNSGAGQVVTKALSSRKRTLVERWAQQVWK